MIGKLAKTSIFVAASVVSLSGVAFGDSLVSLDTGYGAGANLNHATIVGGADATSWQVTRVSAADYAAHPALYASVNGAYSGPLTLTHGAAIETNTHFGTGPTAILTNPVTPPWVDPATVGDGLASWVSAGADYGIGYSGDVNGTVYQYTNTFTMTAGVGSLFTLGGAFSTDNALLGYSLVDLTDPSVNPITIQVSPESVPTAVPNSEYAYNYVFDAIAGAEFNAPDTHQYALTLDVLNAYENAAGTGSEDPGTLHGGATPGPTGMIFSGFASASRGGSIPPVPLPKSAGPGLSMLAGLGIYSALRKRFSRASNVV